MTPIIARRPLLRAGAGALVAGLARPALAAPALPATITLDWRISGYHTPFFVGLDRGIFAREGLELKVNFGTGSRNTVLAVASNNTTFGLADASVLPAAALQGATVKMFCGYLLTTSFGVMFKRASGIQKPKDLEGRSYGDSPGSATYGLWPAFAKRSGIDISKVKLVNVSPAAMNSAFIDGQFDATYTAMNGSFITLSHRGNDLAAFDYADYDLGLMSLGMIATDATLANKDLVRRFVAAWRASLAETIADPARAAAVTRTANPDAAPADELIEMMADTFKKRIVSKATAGQPVGWMAPEDWAFTARMMAEYGGLRDRVVPESLYTNDFVATA